MTKASYNKKNWQLILKDNILAADNFKNQIRAGYAEYNKNSKIFRTQGFTSITTSEKYIFIQKIYLPMVIIR